jgi:hypothetical protein
MQDRYTNLRFIIGLFFFLMALLVMAAWFVADGAKLNINLYSSLAFGVFGLAMMFGGKAGEE